MKLDPDILDTYLRNQSKATLFLRHDIHHDATRKEFIDRVVRFIEDAYQSAERLHEGATSGERTDDQQESDIDVGTLPVQMAFDLHDGPERPSF